MWQIIINGPGYFDTAYELPEGMTSLGRADENDIVLSGDLVSRKHANLHARGDGVKLEDLGSRNGSRINGRGVQGVHDLKEGDLVVVGENTLTLRSLHQSVAARPGDCALNAEPALTTSSVTAGNSEVQSAVIFSRKVKESVVLRALDNVFPFVPFGAESVLPAPPASHPLPSPLGVANVGSVPPYEAVLLLYKVAEALASAEDLAAFLDTSLELVKSRRFIKRICWFF